MTTALEQLHAAHKARLARFAAAAQRHNRPADIFLPAPERVIEPEVAPEHEPRRRAYEMPGRVSANMPIASRILRIVAAEFGMTINEMLSENRDLRFTTPRYVCIGLMLETTTMSFPAIGRRLQRDHTTILNGRKKIGQLLESEAFRNRFDQLKAEVLRDE